MLKNFLFTALLLCMIATYLSYKEWRSTKKSFPFSFVIIGIASFIVMIGLTIDLFFYPTAVLLHTPYLLWTILIIGIVIEIFSLFKKLVAGQLLAASLLLFLVMPTILSIGIVLLIASIVILLIAFLTFQKTKKIGF